MQLEEMRYFVEIVKAKSINQASKTLFIAQPALSRMIAALEKELGFPLLERSKQGIIPTKAGLEVYADCLNMLQLYTNCTAKWRDLAYQVTEDPTVVRIVALPMICNTTMIQVFYEIAQKYPRIRLELYEKQLPDILQKMLEQPNTICLSHYNPQTRDDIYSFAKKHHMQLRSLFDDEYRFFASCDNPLVGKHLTARDLKECTLASYASSGNHNPSFAVYGLSGIDEKVKNTIYLSNKESIMEMTANNQAISASAVIMTQDNFFRITDRVKILNLDSFCPPITYYIMSATDATLEETIVANILYDRYFALSGETP